MLRQLCIHEANTSEYRDSRYWLLMPERRPSTETLRLFRSLLRQHKNFDETDEETSCESWDEKCRDRQDASKTLLKVYPQASVDARSEFKPWTGGWKSCTMSNSEVDLKDQAKLCKGNRKNVKKSCHNDRACLARNNVFVCNGRMLNSLFLRRGARDHALADGNAWARGP